MFIGFWGFDVREIEYLAGMEHCVNESFFFVRIEAVDKHRHDEGRDLIVGPTAVANSVYERVDMFAAELSAVALYSDDLLRCHLIFDLGQQHYCVRSNCSA